MQSLTERRPKKSITVRRSAGSERSTVVSFILWKCLVSGGRRLRPLVR